MPRLLAPRISHLNHLIANQASRPSRPPTGLRASLVFPRLLQPSERCAEVSTVTFPMRGRCPSSLAASHAHVWACSRAQERRVDPPLHDLQRFCARQMGSIGGEGWGKGSAMRRSEAPLASGEDPRTSFQQHASPVPSVAALGLGLLRLLLPWLGPPVCKIVINRISVLCVLVVALLSRPY